MKIRHLDITTFIVLATIAIVALCAAFSILMDCAFKGVPIGP